MTDFFSALSSYVLLALVSVTLQNIVFARALGVSRLVALSEDTVDAAVFTVLLTATTVSSSAMYYWLNRLVLIAYRLSPMFRPLAAVLAMSVSFLLIFVLAVKLLPYEIVGKAAEAMPLAAFNCTVLGTMLLGSTSTLGFAGNLVFAVGSSLGYMLAVLLVGEGQRKLQSRDIPAAFRGLPAILLYIAGLAVALYGFTGYGYTL